MKDLAFLVNQPAAPLKAVLILGEGQPDFPESIRLFYQQNGYLLIGNGADKLQKLDFSVLAGNIDNKTRIFIWAHGNAINSIHYIEGMPTAWFLEQIAGFNKGVPLNIQLFSCFGGAAASAITNLPKGSVLTAHAPSNRVTSFVVNSKAVWQLSQDLSNTNLVEDFVHRFALQAKQTVTISVKLDSGVFQHTVRNPDQMLANPENIQIYLEYQRDEFIKAYEQDTGLSLEAGRILEISESEAVDWRNDNFIFRAVVSDEILVEELANRGHAFSDCITYKLNNYSAFMLAAHLGNEKLVEVMLTLAKVDRSIINDSGLKGSTPLMFAVLNGHVSVVRTMLASDKVDHDIINVRDLSGATAFMLAANLGHLAVIETMCASDKVDRTIISAQDNFGRTAFMRAVLKKQLGVLRALLFSHKIDTVIINTPNMEGLTPFMVAASNCLTDVIELMLINDKVDHTVINAQDPQGMTALMMVALDDDRGTAKVMLASDKMDDIAINMKNKEGYTALMLAVDKRHVHMVFAMLASDRFNTGNINTRSDDGYTAFMLSAQLGFGNVARVFIESNKVDHTVINARDPQGRTAFMLAALNGHVSIVKVMLNSAKADHTVINAQDHNGMTALMHAVLKGDKNLIKAMLGFDKVQATIGLTNNDGKTAAQLAEEAGLNEIASLLTSMERSSGAQVMEDSVRGIRSRDGDACELSYGTSGLKTLRFEYDKASTLTQQTASLGKQWTTTYNEAVSSNIAANCVGTNVGVIQPKQSVDKCLGL